VLLAQQVEVDVRVLPLELLEELLVGLHVVEVIPLAARLGSLRGVESVLHGVVRASREHFRDLEAGG